MATIQDRPFSGNYSGLLNQTIVSLSICSICLCSFELMRRKRRAAGRRHTDESDVGVGSVESWEFGYLYQGRCWAEKPSPPLPTFPLAWAIQALKFPESEILKLVGTDATVYCRFLKGTWLFTCVHTFTTMPILLPIHIIYAPADVALKSMNRASLASLVENPSGQKLLFIHFLLTCWIAVTWSLNLLWIIKGSLMYRARKVHEAVEEFLSESEEERRRDLDSETRGVRLRSVMVTNVPPQLRSEQHLAEYFRYYMSKRLHHPTTIEPGFLSRLLAFMFNSTRLFMSSDEVDESHDDDEKMPLVDKVIVVRKMTELAYLLSKREVVLKKLEHADIKLAQKALTSVEDQILKARADKSRTKHRQTTARKEDLNAEDTREAQNRMASLMEALGPFVVKLGLLSPSRSSASWSTRMCALLSFRSSQVLPFEDNFEAELLGPGRRQDTTVWDALHGLPPENLHAYQPLIRLSSLFRGQTVPAIDFYTTQLRLLTARINEARSAPRESFQPSSTAFVTFRDTKDAKRACDDLPAHPRNPLVCEVQHAPDVGDLDWVRLMKTQFTGEFFKNWVVNIGVWVFTLFWVVPVSLLVGLVSISNISNFIPPLKNYFDRNPDREELISSLLPTVLVSLLALLIPLLLLLIAKKGQNIVTLTKLHDQILTRYYKFLVCNVVIFFCVGTSALEAFLASFRQSLNPLPLIAASIPVAAPFYVGWLIFQTAMHSALQIALFGLPLILYPATVRGAASPRARAQGIRPRTIDYFYWLPNHLVVVVIVLAFSVMNPLVIPFAMLYFFVALTVFKNQFIHVYSHKFERNGMYLVVRIVRYSLDGLILAQAVFLALLVIVGEQKALAGLTGVLMFVVLGVKLYFTRLVKLKFGELDVLEARIICHCDDVEPPKDEAGENIEPAQHADGVPLYERGTLLSPSMRFWTWRRLPATRFNFNYASVPVGRDAQRRKAIPSFEPGSKLPTSNQPSAEGGNTPSPPSPSSPSSLASPVPPHLVSSSPESEHRPPLQHQNSLVTTHPPTQRWDDRPKIDCTYENPFYVQPLPHALWLPLNPCGLIDLDQTIDFHSAITSEGDRGRLTRWLHSGSTMSQPFLTATPDALTPGSMQRASQIEMNGDETVELPPIIAARARKESNVEEAEPPVTASKFRRRPSAGQTEPSSLVVPSRSLSSTLPRRPSVLSTSSRRPRSVFVRETTPERGGEGYIEAGVRRRPRAGTVVSMQEAVFGEVLAEEELANDERLQREAEEEEKHTTTRRRWYNAWLYARRPEVTE